MIQTVQGVGGGYRLCYAPDKISLYDILALTEQSMEINGCLVREEFCSRHATATCPVRRVYSNLNEVIANTLKATTIQSLINGD